MELDVLKEAWQKMDVKLQKTVVLNAELIDAIINRKSRHILEKMKRQNTLMFLIMAIGLLFYEAILLGNILDFKYTWQFIPYVINFVVIIFGLISLYRFNKIILSDMASNSLKNTIQYTLHYYQNNKKHIKWIGIISITTSFLVPWTILPNLIESRGLNSGLMQIGILTAMTLGGWFIVSRLKVMKKWRKENLSSTIAEWKELERLNQSMEGE
jgi:hypothetical protein